MCTRGVLEKQDLYLIQGPKLDIDTGKYHSYLLHESELF